MSDNKVILLLIFALVFQVLLLLWHMEIIQLSNSANRQGLVAAGSIRSVENNLKRRPLDSLVWETSAVSEEVYFHDSVLTLSNSTARIELKNGTNINLSENTLVTIEPPQADKPNEIRIQFTKGDIKARNPYSRTKIEGQNMVLQVEANSDVEIFQNEKGKVEVIVNEGQAKLSHNEKSVDIKSKEIVSLDDNLTEKRQLTNQLIWGHSELLRSYTHGQSSQMRLFWQGSAIELWVENQSGQINKWPISQNQQQQDLDLPLGEYRLTLVHGKKQSHPLQVQVWPAPLIQLVRPLPRNRTKFGDTTFIWTPHRSVASYELELKDQEERTTHPATDNALNLNLNNEQDVEWQVWGVDEKGFRIPPRYSYPLFIRSNPFAPPKLHKPKLLDQKEPKLKTSWIHFLFFPQAHAQESQALFTWEKVNGADVYFVEISESTDFRSTIIQEKVKEEKFIWTGAEKNKTYYWRVAAGDESGRMGVFSEPTLVEWTEVQPEIIVQKPKPKPPVVKRPKVIEKPIKETPSVKAPEKKSVAVGTSESEKEKKWTYLESISLFWNPGYVSKNYKKQQRTKAGLSGLQLIDVSVYSLWNFSPESQFLLNVHYSLNTFTPDPKSEYPFQEDLTLSQARLEMAYKKTLSSWSFGAFFAQWPDIKRADTEKVETLDRTSYGPFIRWNMPYQSFNGSVQASAGLINNGYFFGSEVQITAPIFSGLVVGGEIEFELYNSSQENSSQFLNSKAILGWQF